MWNTYALVWILAGVIPTDYDIVVNQEERETVVVVWVQFQLSIPTDSTRT